MNATGIILAGGKSSRMGSDKGLLELDGKPMIKHIIDNLALLEIPTMIISNNEEYRRFGLPVHFDKVKDKGPVGGIYSGLSHTETEINIILSCDVPFVSKNLMTYLLENSSDYDIVIPKLGEKIHPLVGIYKKSSIETFKSHLQREQRKLITVCNSLNSHIIDLGKHSTLNDPRLFSNINTREELNTIEL